MGGGTNGAATAATAAAAACHPAGCISDGGHAGWEGEGANGAATVDMSGVEEGAAQRPAEAAAAVHYDAKGLEQSRGSVGWRRWLRHLRLLLWREVSRTCPCNPDPKQMLDYGGPSVPGPALSDKQGPCLLWCVPPWPTVSGGGSFAAPGCPLLLVTSQPLVLPTRHMAFALHNW